MAPADLAIVAAYALAAGLAAAGVAWAACRALAARLPAALVAGGLVAACAAVDFVAFVDARLYALVGVHVYAASVREALTNAAFKRQLAIGPALWWRLALVFAAVALAEALVYLALARLSARFSKRAVAFVTAAFSVAFAVAAAVALGGRATIAGIAAAPTSIVGLVPAHDLVFRRTPPAPLFTRAYPRVAAMPQLARKPTILFIAVESLRADALGPALMPRLDAFARAHRCLVPAHHFSSSHVTELSVFSLLYGLDAYHLAPFAHDVVDSFPLALLRANGYRVAGASASTLRHWAMSDFMLRQLEPYAEFDAPRGWQRDAALAAWARRFLATFDARTPSFLFLFFDATHVDYSYPPAFAVDKPALDDDWLRALGAEVADAPPSLRAPMRARYRNSVRFVDDTIGALLEEQAAALDAGRLAVVVVGDHGEAFWEHGAWGHLGAPTDPAAIEVPLVACLPAAANGGAAPPPVAVSSHADVMPTLLDALGTDATARPGRVLERPLAAARRARRRRLRARHAEDVLLGARRALRRRRRHALVVRRRRRQGAPPRPRHRRRRPPAADPRHPRTAGLRRRRRRALRHLLALIASSYSMATTSSSSSPAGVRSVVVSPTRRPVSALATGERQLTRPRLRIGLVDADDAIAPRGAVVVLDRHRGAEAHHVAAAALRGSITSAASSRRSSACSRASARSFAVGSARGAARTASISRLSAACPAGVR